MFMKFYNNIYASAYRSYDKYENGPRYKAASFIFVCFLGLFAMILALIKKIFVLDLTSLKNYSGYSITVLIIGFFFLGIVWKYYSKERVESIISDFESKEVRERKLWGFIAVASFVLPYIAFIILLG